MVKQNQCLCVCVCVCVRSVVITTTVLERSTWPTTMQATRVYLGSWTQCGPIKSGRRNLRSLGGSVGEVGLDGRMGEVGLPDPLFTACYAHVASGR